MLIVEDNELVTDALRILFEETGRRVTVAHSVADAVKAGESDPPDLLLLDMRLPDGEGLDVARSLTRSGVVPKATVALTGQDDPETTERCVAAGCSAVMLKPVATRDLLRKAEEWLA
ncbi:MAG: response regulator [Gemmatimonadaceae bacterium]